MNKHKQKDLDLKQAFPPMPDDCFQALMHAARSVKEEEPMKKTSFRTVLIAVSLIILTMAVALAANELGIISFMDRFRARLPESALNLMAKTENKTFTVGPLEITLRELLADGRVVLMTAHANKADKSPAVLVAGSGDMSDRIPEIEARRLKLPRETTFIEAARQIKTPLYIVYPYLTIDFDLLHGEEMMDEFYAEDGTLLQMQMLQTKPDQVNETLKAMLTLHVREINPETKEQFDGKEWRVDEMISIPVNKTMTEKNYTPDGNDQLDGYTVKSLKAEQTVAGIYLTTQAEAGSGVKRENVYQTLYTWEYRTVDDEPFPDGISMSGSLADDSWPVVTLYQMIGLDKFPDVMKLSGCDGISLVILK
ncbi:MAG: hypothetical protein ACOX62_05970 [Christensenellales bacterium]|jgi:hypothetical protein